MLENTLWVHSSDNDFTLVGSKYFIGISFIRNLLIEICDLFCKVERVFNNFVCLGVPRKKLFSHCEFDVASMF
jgi:hypothetical protein